MDSIFNKIVFARPKSTKEGAEAAAKIANAHEFIINTEQRYATNIGDKESKLSGGQRQRICIAQTVLNIPPIMHLDEATSALNTASEKLVRDARNNWLRNRTSLIIAQRLSTIQNADMILVLEKGRIVERGNHRNYML